MATASRISGDRYVWKLDPSDGSTVWKANPPLGNMLFSGVSLSATGTVFTTGRTNGGSTGLYAIDPSDGSLIWERLVGDVVNNIPAFDAEGGIYVGTVGSSNTGAFDKVSSGGVLEWSFTEASPGANHYPAVIDSQGRVYAGAKNRTVYALDPDDGSVIWSYNLGGSSRNEPRGFAVGDGVIYVVGYDGKVYALGD